MGVRDGGDKMQGCGLGLDVSVSRRKTQDRRLGLISDSNVSCPSRTRWSMKYRGLLSVGVGRLAARRAPAIVTRSHPNSSSLGAITDTSGKDAWKMLTYSMAVWCGANVVGRINQVTLRRARLVLGWVTGRRRAGVPLRYVASHPGQLLSAGREMSTGQSAVMLCSWEVNAVWLIPSVDARAGGRKNCVISRQHVTYPSALEMSIALVIRRHTIYPVY